MPQATRFVIRTYHRIPVRCLLYYMGGEFLGKGTVVNMSRNVDYVSPMVYPSHYARGEYGIPEPNREPYKVVHRTLSDATKRLGGDFAKLRPYLQDFSLFGVHYGVEQVKAQIQACDDVGVKDWLLWNPN